MANALEVSKQGFEVSNREFSQVQFEENVVGRR
jgi:hypothetical protein